MFYYYLGDTSKKYKKRYLDGWRKKDIINFKGDADAWKIKVGQKGNIQVEIYPHFLESLAESINSRGVLHGFDFYEKRFMKIDRKTSKSFLQFYKKYQSQADQPLPPEAFGILLTCLSYAPYFYYEINKWIKTHPTDVEKWEDNKINNSLDLLYEEHQRLIRKEEKRGSDKLQGVRSYYELMLKDTSNISRLKKIDREYQQTLIDVSTAEDDRLVEIDEKYQELKYKILDDTYYPSFVFKVNGFYVVMAKVGEDTLRLRTMYGNIDIPRNTFVAEIELDKIDILSLLPMIE